MTILTLYKIITLNFLNTTFINFKNVYSYKKNIKLSCLILNLGINKLVFSDLKYSLIEL